MVLGNPHNEELSVTEIPELAWDLEIKWYWIKDHTDVQTTKLQIGFKKAGAEHVNVTAHVDVPSNYVKHFLDQEFLRTLQDHWDEKYRGKNVQYVLPKVSERPACVSSLVNLVITGYKPFPARVDYIPNFSLQWLGTTLQFSIWESLLRFYSGKWSLW